ncbi:hypothetical protein [Chryseobacterium arthrosphaerae]|uniref:Uncharacterized protein n=1 Tax=Chryseobacterium arthrosphaerae TaxID=651561 RepID=A0A1B8ZIC6_9FLAO|nr:hypothetical protein [Chryseobacterium arthrosphaerae]OCA71353.1 hypothetical protein BBI00_16665 [Chryseobacterium arthrosphaerae]
MKIGIKEIIDHGTHESERILLSVKENCNLVRYIIADNTYLNKYAVSNKVRHTYWFTSQKVIAGDEILVYTGKGKNSQESIKNSQNTRYIFFWGLDINVWNNNLDSAILIEVNDTDTKVVKV